MLNFLEFLITVFFLYFLFKKDWLAKKPKKSYLLFRLLLVIFAHYIVNFIPFPTDSISITALETKNQHAEGYQVAISGISVNDSYTSTFEVLEDTWFWGNGRYQWRPESHNSRPDGLLPTTVIAVPIGENRKIHFMQGQDFGLVQVKTDDFSEELDLYAATNTEVQCTLPNSSFTSILLFYLFLISIYSLFLWFGHQTIEKLEKLWQENSLWKKRLSKENGFQWKLVCLCILHLCIVFPFANYASLWFDEICQVIFSEGNGTLFGQLFLGAMPVPLSTFIQRIFYFLVPYGEEWYRLPAMLATIFGIYVVGYILKSVTTPKIALFTTLVLVSSGTLAEQCSLQARGYGLYFASSAVLLFVFFKRFRFLGEETAKKLLPLSFAMIFFSQMHYVAVILILGYFTIDFLLICQKKSRIIALQPYFISGFCYLPLVYVNVQRMLISDPDFVEGSTIAWHKTPTLNEVLVIINYLTSNNSIVTFILSFTFVCLIISIINKKTSSKLSIFQQKEVVITGYLLFWQLAFLFTWGQVLNYFSLDLSTFWCDRYFVCLLPMTYIMFGLGCSFLHENYNNLVSEKTENILKILKTSFFAGLFLLNIANLSQSLIKEKGYYRQSAEYIYDQIDYIYDEKTVVVCSNHLLSGWIAYYLENLGNVNKINLLDLNDIKSDPSILDPYDRIYNEYAHNAILYSSDMFGIGQFIQIDDDRDAKIVTYARRDTLPEDEVK